MNKKEMGKEIKIEVVKEFIEIPEQFKNLIGDDSAKAWEKRRKLEKENPKEVIISLAGVKSEEARKYLTERLGKGKNQKFWYSICRSLMTNDSVWANETREWLRFDSEVGRVRAGINARLVKFFGLHKSKWWWKLRRKVDEWFPPGLYLPGDLLISTIGIRSKRKNELVEEFGELFPAEAILCWIGDNSPKAHQKVEKYYGGDKKLNWAYITYIKSIKSQ